MLQIGDMDEYVPTFMAFMQSDTQVFSDFDTTIRASLRSTTMPLIS
ncbi:MAG: hypothetical protein QNJ72_23155 [Pleurocapsa sp. MO_226.B13]|nr:hypothetical protein [Pleurocapsa sp. MO_226.B13]